MSKKISINYVIRWMDKSGKYHQFSYQSLDNALDDFLENHLNVKISEKEARESCEYDHKYFNWTFEHNGYLYNKLLFHDEDTRPNPENLLFKDYTAEKPKTIQQLRTYIAVGNEIILNWSEKDPEKYQLLKVKG